MYKFIECSELGFNRDIPAEMIKLEKQNAELIKNNRFFKKVLISTAIGIGILLIIELVKTIKNEKRKKT